MIRVLLVDDHVLFRQGLRRLLDSEPDLEVAGEAGDGLEAQRMVDELSPDVVLMDIGLPLVEGISASREICRRWPSARVVMLSMYSDEAHVLQALRGGAAGYVLKSAGIEMVVAAVRAAANGGGLLSPGLTGTVLSELRRLAASGGPGEGLGCLGETELKMLQLLASGRSNKQMARDLCLANSTVKNRLSTLFQKIGVSDRTQAAVYAIEHGIAPVRSPRETVAAQAGQS
jgi:DNA-binding NarL/FixJ family response regulator